MDSDGDDDSNKSFIEQLHGQPGTTQLRLPSDIGLLYPQQMVSSYSALRWVLVVQYTFICVCFMLNITPLLMKPT